MYEILDILIEKGTHPVEFAISNINGSRTLIPKVEYYKDIITDLEQYVDEAVREGIYRIELSEEDVESLSWEVLYDDSLTSVDIYISSHDLTCSCVLHSTGNISEASKADFVGQFRKILKLESVILITV